MVEEKISLMTEMEKIHRMHLITRTKVLDFHFARTWKCTLHSTTILWEPCKHVCTACSHVPRHDTKNENKKQKRTSGAYFENQKQIPPKQFPPYSRNSSRQYFAKINCSICSYPFNQWIFRHWRNLIKSIFEIGSHRTTCSRPSRCPWHCTTALWRQSERTHTFTTTHAINKTSKKTNPNTHNEVEQNNQSQTSKLHENRICDDIPRNTTLVLWPQVKCSVCYPLVAKNIVLSLNCMLLL